MHNGRHGGLTGKARRVHYQSRFESRVCREFMDECLNPTPTGARVERYIPVRHGSELLCEVGFANPDSTYSPFSQLDLPFSRNAEGDGAGRAVAAATETARPDVAWKPSDANRPAVVVVTADKRTPHAPTRASDVIIPSRRTRGTARPSDGPSEFRLHRFLAGCLIGGSAAAVILLILYAIIS